MLATTARVDQFARSYGEQRTASLPTEGLPEIEGGSEESPSVRQPFRRLVATEPPSSSIRNGHACLACDGQEWVIVERWAHVEDPD
jgi:hypothetical protein